MGTTPLELNRSYDYQLLLLALVIAIASTYAALDLAGRIWSVGRKARMLWLTVGASAMGVGFCSMNYSVLFAMRLAVPVRYHWPTILISLLAAIYTSIVPLLLSSRKTLNKALGLTAGLLMGTGIVTLQNLGIAAIRLPAIRHYSSAWTALSVVFDVLFANCAIWQTFNSRKDNKGWSLRKFIGACTIGCTVPLLHLIALRSINFLPVVTPLPPSAHSISISSLQALCIGAAVLLVLAAIVASIVADRRHRLEHELLDAFLEYIPENVYFKDRNSRFICVNQAMADYCGLSSRAKAIDKADEDIFTSEHSREAFADEQYIILSGKSIIGKEEKETWRDGRETWVLTTKVPLRNALGEIVGTMGISHDISVRKKLEQELDSYKRDLERLVQKRTSEAMQANQDLLAAQALELESTRRHRQIIETAFDAFVGMDVRGNITDWNKQAETIFGWRREEALGKSLSELIVPERERRAHESALAAVRSGASTADRNRRIEMFALHRNGTEFPVDLGIFTIVSGEEGLFGAFIRDMSEHIRTQRDLRRSEEQFRQLAENLREVFFVCELSPIRVIYVTPAYEDVWGHSRAELYANPDSWIRSVHPDDRSLAIKIFADAQRQSPTSAEYRILRSDGSMRWIANRNFHVHDAQGEVVRLVGIAEDITERKAREDALREAHSQLSAALSLSQQRTSESEKITDLVDTLQSCLSIEEAYEVIATVLPTILGSPDGCLCAISASRDQVEPVASWGNPPGTGEPFSPEACWALRRERIHHSQISQFALRCRHLTEMSEGEYLCVPLSAQGESIGSLVLRVPPAEEKLGDAHEMPSTVLHRRASAVGERLSLALTNLRLREVLRNQSIRDPLTGLFNRRYMEASLEREFRDALSKNSTLAVMMIDVDHFKEFNDTFGHQTGDAVLREIGELLKQVTQKRDIACRFGGEEFVMILTDTSLEFASIQAESVRDQVRLISPRHMSKIARRVTISIGIAVFPHHGGTPEELMQKADAALYRAKMGGRDRVVLA